MTAKKDKKNIEKPPNYKKASVGVKVTFSGGGLTSPPSATSSSPEWAGECSKSRLASALASSDHRQHCGNMLSRSYRFCAVAWAFRFKKRLTRTSCNVVTISSDCLAWDMPALYISKIPLLVPHDLLLDPRA